MGKRNLSLKETLNKMQPKESLVASLQIPEPDSTNLSGAEAYTQDKWLTFLTMLNTLKLDPQYYRSIDEQIIHFQLIFHECASEDPYLTAQCLVYSRCVSDGMRSITQIGASLLPQYVSGQAWMKNFFSVWDKKKSVGGVIFRPDDMQAIAECIKIMNQGSKLPNSLKKAFKQNLETLDPYSILKYKNRLIDVINLTHPNPHANMGQLVEIDGGKEPVLTSVMKGLKVSADTWEVAQSEAGKLVAEAIKEGKMTEEEAQEKLKESKAKNWNGLLADKKLGILAAIRNLRSILSIEPDKETLDMLSLLIENVDLIRQGKIMPYQFDLAYESIRSFGNTRDGRKMLKSLSKAYESSVPNLADILTGRNLVLMDCSGSMNAPMFDPVKKTSISVSCMDKAKLLTATILKSTNADLIQFGSDARYKEWDPNMNVFDLADEIHSDMGATNLASAWKLAMESGRSYDRVFVVSDNECNVGKTYKEYQKYVQQVGDPYVYSIDLAAYGKSSMAGPKVRYYFGYGYTLFDDLKNNEFNPDFHLEKAKKIIL